MKLLMSKLRDDPTPPSERDPSLPRRVDSVLLRGLARVPAARWKSCSMMVEALAAVLEPKADLFATTQPIRLRGLGGWWGDRKRRWRDEAWLGLMLVGVLTLVAVFIVVPRLHPAPSAPGTGGPTVVPCPAVSPSPQLTASPNPATTGEPVTYTASGFQTGDPLFIVIDGAGDCTNPTAGAKVFNSSSYTDPVQTDPSPLPAPVTPGDYQVRACNQRPGEPPINCVQVPFSVVAAPTPSPAETPSPSASPSPS
jgi:hypothetical protein